MAAGTDGGADAGSWAVAVACGAVLVNFVTAIVGWVWTLGRSGRATDEKIANKDKAVTQDFIDLERRLGESIDKSVHDFGETVQAIRTKINEVELWNRDNFVSKNTFKAVTEDLKRSWERFEDKLAQKLTEIDKELKRIGRPDASL